MADRWADIRLDGKDFRVQGSFIFLDMKSLYRLANETIVNKLDCFYEKAHSNIELLTRSESELATTLLFNKHRTTLTNGFHTSIQILKDTSHANFY